MSEEKMKRAVISTNGVLGFLASLWQVLKGVRILADQKSFETQMEKACPRITSAYISRSAVSQMRRGHRPKILSLLKQSESGQ